MRDFVEGIFGHGNTCRCRACIERNSGATMYPATGPAWNMELDASIRNAHMVDPGRYGNSARENDAELFQLDQVVGHEAEDYQNPYAFMAGGVLGYPSPFGSQLDPRYGLGGDGTAEADVATNIQATKNAIMHV
jgi:hypothetical protein